MQEQFVAKVVEHSTAAHGKELITLQLTYPRFIHAEFMTHRVFSRNAASSRAIPVAKMIEQVDTNPAMPIHWGKNQPGMQAHAEHDGIVMLDRGTGTGGRLLTAEQAWCEAARQAAFVAEAMAAAGYHKQVVNRLLEPFQLMHVIVTATEWGNFFELRDHPDAQPEIRHLAQLMKAAMVNSLPIHRGGDARITENWHLPYVTQAERTFHYLQPKYLAKLSAARCARVSYLNHDGSAPDANKDLQLYERLVGSKPLHASPVEHQGAPFQSSDRASRNFRGWLQFRELVEDEIFDGVEHEGATPD